MKACTHMHLCGLCDKRDGTGIAHSKANRLLLLECHEACRSLEIGYVGLAFQIGGHM